VGLAGSAGGWLDTDNIMLKLKTGGELALVLGLKGDVEVQFGPFNDVPLSKRLGFTSSKSGTILSDMKKLFRILRSLKVFHPFYNNRVFSFFRYCHILFIWIYSTTLD